MLFYSKCMFGCDFMSSVLHTLYVLCPQFVLFSFFEWVSDSFSQFQSLFFGQLLWFYHNKGLMEHNNIVIYITFHIKENCFRLAHKQSYLIVMSKLWCNGIALFFTREPSLLNLFFFSNNTQMVEKSFYIMVHTSMNIKIYKHDKCEMKTYYKNIMKILQISMIK